MVRLNTSQIQDQVIRENFSTTEQEFNGLPLRKGDWTHIELTVAGAVSHFKYPHNLGFLPKDVIQTYCTPGITVTYNIDSFTSSNLDITTTGPCTLRFFVGTYFKR